MRWWQTLLVATVPALVTLVGLLIQQRSNNRREDRRRKQDADERERDRVHQAEQAKSERAHHVAMTQDERLHEYTKAHDALALENDRQDRHRSESLMERWRDERKAVHVNMLTTIADALGALDTALANLPADDGDRTIRQDEPISALSTEQKAALSERLATVQVIGSSGTRNKADECFEAMTRLDVLIWGASFGGDTKSKLFTLFSQCERLRLEYIDAVRGDLGTDTTAPIDTYWPTYPGASQAWGRQDEGHDDPWAVDNTGEQGD